MCNSFIYRLFATHVFRCESTTYEPVRLRHNMLITAVLVVVMELAQGPVHAGVADVAVVDSEATSPDGVLSRQPGVHESATSPLAKDWLAAARRYLTLYEYRASYNVMGLQAPSRRHAFRTFFEPTGIRLVDRLAEGNPQLLALRLEHLGRVNAPTDVAPGEVVGNGNRVEIRRGSLLEWYVNSPAGLEQGFTLIKRVEGSGPVVLDLSLEGASALRSGDTVRITSATGRQLNYGELKAVDATGVTLTVALSVPSDNHIQLQVDDTDAVYPIVIDPVLMSAAETQLESDQRGALLGFSVAGAGDVNGDGYADVIVGAWRYDAGEKDEGAAFIFHGSASGIPDASPATANTRLESDQVGAEMGEKVAGAGDVNGDGYDDVIVGAWHYDAGEIDEGAAFIFYGSAAGIASGSVASANARLESNQAGANFGLSLDSAGDVNGDGYDDVIVGTGHYNAGETEEGAVFIFNGSAAGITSGHPDTANTRITGEQAGAMLGTSVAGAGDVNGDGFADVIVGAQAFDAGETDEGAAFVFLGSASGIPDATPATADARFEGDQAEAWMGVTVGGAGDVNGDGYDDVIVGARRYDLEGSDEGAAFIFQGAASGLTSGGPSIARTRLTGDQSGGWLGSSVDSAGDVNGDGYADVIIGASRYDTSEQDTGAAFLFLGSASGVANGGPASAYAAFEADQLNARMGYGASGAGDVNGDGFGDVIVGIYQYDCGQKDEGAAYIFLGGKQMTSGSAGFKADSMRSHCETITTRRYSRKKIAAAFIACAGLIGGGIYLMLRRRRHPGSAT